MARYRWTLGALAVLGCGWLWLRRARQRDIILHGKFRFLEAFVRAMFHRVWCRIVGSGRPTTLEELTTPKGMAWLTGRREKPTFDKKKKEIVVNHKKRPHLLGVIEKAKGPLTV